MKEETLEEAADNYSKELTQVVAFYQGAKWQEEQDKNKYSEEEVEQIARFGFNAGRRVELKAVDLDFTFEQWFEQFSKLKKSKQ
jgi:hypothetical protein